MAANEKATTIAVPELGPKYEMQHMRTYDTITQVELHGRSNMSLLLYCFHCRTISGMICSMSHACGKVTGGTHTRRASNVGEAQIATSARVDKGRSGCATLEMRHA